MYHILIKHFNNSILSLQNLNLKIRFWHNKTVADYMENNILQNKPKKCFNAVEVENKSCDEEYKAFFPLGFCNIIL